MERGGPLALVLVFGGAFSLFLLPFVDCREFRLSSACYSDTLRLECGKSVIAVHEAYFTSASRQHNRTCLSPAPPGDDDYIEDDDADDDDETGGDEAVCREDIRVAINRRCSGFKSCNFSYSQQPEKSCYSPEGLSVVRFDCVRESTINKYCNSKITTQEGYIASPGYPQYYPQLHSCSWSLSASEGQTILASVLHLHIRESTEATPTMTSPELDFHVMGQLVEEAVRRCDDDWLRLVEDVVKKVEVCGEGEEGLRSVEVEGAAGMEVRFRSVAFMPASGFLIYYKIQGCPTLPSLEDSFLLDRNGSAAAYACRAPRQVFNDTLRPTRLLRCVRDHHWNDTVPPCVPVDDITSTTLTVVSSVDVEDMENFTMPDNEKISFPVVDHKANLVADIIIPCVIIGVLLIVNGIVLVVIFAVRRRQKPIEAEFEGLSEAPPPIVSEEKFEEESPQPSLNEGESKTTVSKKVTEQSPQTSLTESQSQPTVSQEAKGSDSPPTALQDAKRSDSQPTVAQEAEGIESHQTLSQLLETLSSSKESCES